MRLAKRAQSEEEDDARKRGIRTKAELSQIVRSDAQLAEEAEYEQYVRIEAAAKVILKNIFLNFLFNSKEQRRQEEEDEARASELQRAELEHFRREEKRLQKINELAERDAELARRLARLEEEEENNEAEHDESLAIELAEREREVQRLKKVLFKN